MIWLKVDGIDRWLRLDQARRIRVFESGTRRRGRHAVAVTAAGHYEDEWGRDLKMDKATAVSVCGFLRFLASSTVPNDGVAGLVESWHTGNEAVTARLIETIEVYR